MGEGPFLRLRRFLVDQKLWDEARRKAWVEECGKQVDVEINAYLETPCSRWKRCSTTLYADMPADVMAQRDAAISQEKRA